jgi:hypothetical protein
MRRYCRDCHVQLCISCVTRFAKTVLGRFGKIRLGFDSSRAEPGHHLMVAVDVGFAKSNYVDEPASPNLLFEKSVPAAEILVGQYAQVAQSCGWARVVC